MLPKAILFDLDDTLISAYNRSDRAWLAIALEFSADLHPHPPAEVAAAINLSADVFWADPERHRVGRLQLLDARATIIADAFEALAKAGRVQPGGTTVSFPPAVMAIGMVNRSGKNSALRFLYSSGISSFVPPKAL